PGPTARNAPLYGPPDFAYVYLNYGIHELVNAVTEPEGSPAAILIRALDPLDGLELMRARRAARRPQDAPPVRDVELCRGPGNLTVAMAIDRTLNCADLTGGPMWIEDRGIMPADLSYSARIGIRVGVDRAWRCTWHGHPAVSGRVRRQVAGWCAAGRARSARLAAARFHGDAQLAPPAVFLDDRARDRRDDLLADDDAVEVLDRRDRLAV